MSEPERAVDREVVPDPDSERNPESEPDPEPEAEPVQRGFTPRDLRELYRTRVLEPFGVGIPFLYGCLGVASFLSAAPGIATFWIQNAYAQIGIGVICLFGATLLVAAGYDYHRLDSTRWKLTRERDGPLAEAAPDGGQDDA